MMIFGGTMVLLFSPSKDTKVLSKEISQESGSLREIEKELAVIKAAIMTHHQMMMEKEERK